MADFLIFMERPLTAPDASAPLGEELPDQPRGAGPGRVGNRQDVVGGIQCREARPGDAGREPLALLVRHAGVVAGVETRVGACTRGSRSVTSTSP